MKTPVFMLTPEFSPVKQAISRLGAQIKNKAGGMADQVMTTSEALHAKGIAVHIFTTYCGTEFKTDEWIRRRHSLPSGKVHTVDSAYIMSLPGIYEGDNAITAARLQGYMRTMIKNVRGEYHGRGVAIANDYMVGGFLSAYMKNREIPFAQVMHNIHTTTIPLSNYFDVPLSEFKKDFYMVGDDAICSLATAVKNATEVWFVGNSFMDECLNGPFPEDMSPHVKRELAVKAEYGQVHAVPNGLANKRLPENQKKLFKKWAHLGARQYHPNDRDLLDKLDANKLAFQRACGLDENPGADILFWPSRLDPRQKGADKLPAIAEHVLEDYPDIQIAVVADGSGEVSLGLTALSDRYYQLEQGRRLVKVAFDESLSDLGYVGSQATISWPRWEPYGLYIPQSLVNGNLVLAGYNGGGKDMIRPYDDGRGNGFHCDGSVESIEVQIRDMVETLRRFRRDPDVRERELRRIMLHAREHYGEDAAVQRCIEGLERMNGGPLTVA